MEKILYIVDDINYNSGAKAVTLFQMRQLVNEYDIYLFSLTCPLEKIDFLKDDHILDDYIWHITEIYAESFKKAMKSKKYSIAQKLSRILYAASLRLGAGDLYFNHLIEKRLIPIFEKFETVVVVSEASKLRVLVSNLKHPKKVQWIHTDYARWCQFSEWSKAVTRNDKSIYLKYDTVVVLSEFCKRGMIQKLPDIAEKIIVIPNLVNGDRILKLAEQSVNINIKSNELQLVTVARIDREKRIDKVLELALLLQQKGIAFKWYIIGDGPEREELERKAKEKLLDLQVIFVGYMENPYPIMKRCQVMVLLSKYEGTPVTIDEAMVLGLNVVAPRVGGISEQLELYAAKYLIDPENLDDCIMGILQKNIRQPVDFALSNKKRIQLIKKALQ